MNMPIGRALEDNEFLHAEMLRLNASDGGELVNRTPGARPGDAADRHPVQAQRLQMALHVHDEQGLDSPQHLNAEHAELVVRAATDPIDWVPGLPISSSADISRRYRKN